MNYNYYQYYNSVPTPKTRQFECFFFFRKNVSRTRDSLTKNHPMGQTLIPLRSSFFFSLFSAVKK